MNYNKLALKVIKKLKISDEQKDAVISEVNEELNRIKKMSVKEKTEELKKRLGELR